MSVASEMGLPELLSVREVASWLGVHDRTVRRMADNGTLPFVKVVGSVRFRLEDVRALIEPSEFVQGVNQALGQSVERIRCERVTP